jgi:hypothetical protein
MQPQFNDEGSVPVEEPGTPVLLPLPGLQPELLLYTAHDIRNRANLQIQSVLFNSTSISTVREESPKNQYETTQPDKDACDARNRPYLCEASVDCGETRVSTSVIIS